LIRVFVAVLLFVFVVFVFALWVFWVFPAFVETCVDGCEEALEEGGLSFEG